VATVVSPEIALRGRHCPEANMVRNAVTDSLCRLDYYFATIVGFWQATRLPVGVEVQRHKLKTTTWQLVGERR
jgi:hypothetical protein